MRVEIETTPPPSYEDQPPPSYESVRYTERQSVVLRPGDLNSHVIPLPPYSAQSSGPPVIQPSDNAALPTTVPTETQAPPPSYDSIYGRVKAAKENSSSIREFCSNVTLILLTSVGFMIILGVLSIHPISEIVIGAMYLHQCPVQRYIPIYLIVIGVFTLVKFISIIFDFCKKQSSNERTNEDNSKQNPLDQLLNFFLFTWFIAGNVWVYGVGNTWVSRPETAEIYCHPTVYYFTFWSITFIYILLGTSCAILCFGTCFLQFLQAKKN